MKNIYKAGFIALVATPLFGLFSQNTYAIMPSTFNDENFYNCVVSNFSSQYPDEVIAESGLTNEQLGRMSSLDCWSRNITDTTGLELMTSLTELGLAENQLTSIDVSKNVNLTELSLLGNQLTSIDVSKNVSLTGLGLANNQLTSIDLSKNVNLTHLGLVNNPLTSIDISKNPDLDFFYVDPTLVVETGVLPESDGDLSTYDFSKFQHILVNKRLSNPCDELDDSLSEECVFEWDSENVRLNVSSSLIGSEVRVYNPPVPGSWSPDLFKLKLTEPKPEEPEEPEEDNEAIVVPNTGAQIEDSNNSKALFPIFGMLLGIMTILFGMSLRSSYKSNEYK